MRHLDLFAGIGGFSLAARWMGWKTVAQVEWDAWCQKVLAKNFPDALRFGDIVEFNKMLENGEITTDSCDVRQYTRGTEQSLPGVGEHGETLSGNAERRIDFGKIDIITGGFPCQPFSHAGKRKGTDDSRYLWPAMLETIRRVKPSYVVGENVAGLVSMENGKTLDRILSDMEDEGYTTEQVIIPACAVGAWHRRDRIWIIGRHNASHNEGIGLCCQEKDGELEGGFRPAKHHKRNGESVHNMWDSEPSVGRVANGIPNRVDRLKGLGNAIVPQVAYEIFKAVNNFYAATAH